MNCTARNLIDFLAEEEGFDVTSGRAKLLQQG